MHNGSSIANLPAFPYDNELVYQNHRLHFLFNSLDGALAGLIIVIDTQSETLVYRKRLPHSTNSYFKTMSADALSQGSGYLYLFSSQTIVKDDTRISLDIISKNDGTQIKQFISGEIALALPRIISSSHYWDTHSFFLCIIDDDTNLAYLAILVLGSPDNGASFNSVEMEIQ